jgi:hypothetical protein
MTSSDEIASLVQEIRKSRWFNEIPTILTRAPDPRPQGLIRPTYSLGLSRAGEYLWGCIGRMAEQQLMEYRMEEEEARKELERKKRHAEITELLLEVRPLYKDVIDNIINFLD